MYTYKTVGDNFPNTATAAHIHWTYFSAGEYDVEMDRVTLIMWRGVKRRMFPLSQLPLNKRSQPVHRDMCRDKKTTKDLTNILVLWSLESGNIKLIVGSQWMLGNYTAKWMQKTQKHFCSENGLTTHLQFTWNFTNLYKLQIFVMWNLKIDMRTTTVPVVFGDTCEQGNAKTKLPRF